MKKEVSNQFTEGLISDLNPINTPNTVLTDAVNATIITYNGNEYCLQNDRGNYELKNCKLYPNYIPVGIKEYNDILYIVSYNPLTKYVQIGSYPSPLIIGELPYDQPEVELKSIIEEQILNQNLTEKGYTELMENAKGLMFDGENFKLNPGDEYCIQLEPSDIKYKYETLAYYILDEESGLHDVTDKIKNDEFGSDPNYEHVGWTVPGWFNIQPRLAELGVAGINVRSFYLPKNANDTTVYFKFNLKLNLNDTYLKNKGILDEWCKLIDEGESLEDVKFRIYVEKENNGEYKSIYPQEYVEFSISDTIDPVGIEHFHLSEYNWNEWYDSNIILWKTISGKFTGLTKKDKLKITMIPVLHDGDYGYKILYDNLKQELLFDLSVSEDNLWSGGDELYQFFPSKDSEFQHIYINIVGPMISSFPVDLYCNIYDLQKNLVLENYKFEDYSGIGENLLTIPYKGDFKKENIYVIKFIFGNSPEDETFPKVCKFLITSEIFNNYKNILVYDRDISFEEWIYPKIETKVNIKELDLPYDNPLYKTPYFDHHSLFTDDDKRYFADKTYNTIFPIQNNLSKEIKWWKGESKPYNVSIERLDKPLLDGIWDYVKFDINQKYNTSVDDDEYSELGWRCWIPHYLETTLKYKQHTEADTFMFMNIEENNFSNDLKIYTGNLLDQIKWDDDIPSNLSDLRIEIVITVAGRTAEKEGEEEKRFILIQAYLCHNSRVLDVKDLFTDEIIESDSLIESDAWIGTKSWHLNKLSEYHQGMSTKMCSDLPRYFVNTILNELNLPFILTKVIYKGVGTTENWEIHQTAFGGDFVADYDFAITDSETKNFWYLAFKSTNEDNMNPRKGYPILLPFISNVDHGKAIQCFEKLCKNLIFIPETDDFPQESGVFKLEEIDTKELFGLKLKLELIPDWERYCGWDLSSTEDRERLIDFLSDFKILNNAIILKGEIENKYIDVNYTYDFKKFNQETYPYENTTYAYDSEVYTYYSVGNLRTNVDRLFSHWNADKSKWINSSYYRELIVNGKKTVEGVYLLDEVSNTLLDEINNTYVNSNNPKNIISLGTERWHNFEGTTKKIMNDLKFTWSFNTILGIFLPLPNQNNDGLFVEIAKMMGGKISDKPSLPIEENGYVSWIVFTNTDNVSADMGGATSARCYVILGSCWKDYVKQLVDYWPSLKIENES